MTWRAVLRRDSFDKRVCVRLTDLPVTCAGFIRARSATPRVALL